MLEMGLPEAARCSVNFFFPSRRRTSFIIDGKAIEPRHMDSGVPQRSQILPLLFLGYTTSLYNRIETGASVVAIIDNIIIHKGGKYIDKTTTLCKLLQICH